MNMLDSMPELGSGGYETEKEKTHGMKARKNPAKTTARRIWGQWACTRIERTSVSDLTWRVLNSSAWCYILVAISSLGVFYRPVFFFGQYGPGNRNHDASSGRVLFTSLYATHFFNSTIYHVLARKRVQKQAQQMLLGRLQMSELFLVGLVALIVAVVRLAGFTQEGSKGWPNGTEVTDASINLEYAPVLGLFASPLVVGSVHMLIRVHLVPRIGEEMQSPVWLADSFLLGFSAVSACIMMVCMAFASVATRFSEWGFGGHFSGRIVYAVEAELGASRLALSGPKTLADIEAFANEHSQSGASVRLARASLQTPTGEILDWISDELSGGLISKAVQISVPEGDFVFSIDPLFTAIVFWDTVMSAGYFLTCAGFYMFARGYMRALLVFPLTSMLSALTQAAALLDEDGRVSPAEDRPADHTRDSLRAASGEGRGVVPRWWTRRATVAPDERGGGMHGVFHVGEAINRVLLLISHSAKTARQDLVPSVRRSRVSEGTAPAGESAKSASGPDLAEAVRASASDAAAAGGATDTDGEGEGEILPDASAVSGSSVSLLAAMEAQSRKSRPRRIRMRFPESVLNWVGSTGWHDCSLQPTELVPAVHLIFIKSRIPASVCERETFVTWAQAMLARHTKLAYHNPWWAVSCMHAAFMLLKESNFMSLSPLRSLAVLASTLAMDVASTGLEDAEICDAKDPLALKYCFSRPQRQAALAAMLEVAYTVEGANIFKTLSDDECAALRGFMRACVFSAGLVGARHLKDQLVVTQSQMRVREAQMQLATGAEVSGSQIPRSTSDLAMEVVVVLSATHHALGGHQKWSTLERLYVAQRVEAKLQRKREERGSDAGAMRKLTTECRQTVMRERAAFWATMRSLVAAAAHVYPSLRPHLEALEEVVEEAGQGLPTSSTGGERHAAASAELRESGTWRTGAVASPH